MTGYHDTKMWKILDECPGAGVAWYLMAAYLYYAHGQSIITDGAFDKLAVFLQENWWIVDDHPHARYISQEDLEAGTLLMDYESLPNLTKDAAWGLLSKLQP